MLCVYALLMISYCPISLALGYGTFLPQQLSWPFYRFVGNSMPFKCMIHHNLYMYYMNHFSRLFHPLLAVITRCTVPHLDSCESETVSSRRPTPSGVATCGASCRYILHEQSSCTESGVTLLMSVIRLASQIGVSGWFPLYGSCTAWYTSCVCVCVCVRARAPPRCTCV